MQPKKNQETMTSHNSNQEILSKSSNKPSLLEHNSMESDVPGSQTDQLEHEANTARESKQTPQEQEYDHSRKSLWPVSASDQQKDEAKIKNGVEEQEPGTALRDASQSMQEGTSTVPTSSQEATVEETGRERLKRHRIEVAGRVWIPEIWGQEDLLKDWVDCTVFDDSLGNKSIMSARASLMEERRRASNSTLRLENSC